MEIGTGQSTLTQETVNHCQVCRERSNWDFLKDFYLRVQAANEHSRKVEADLQYFRASAFGAVNAHVECQAALTECQTTLSECQRNLADEYLEHRASKEALQFLQLKKKSQEESDRYLEYALDAATQSRVIVDDLQSEIAVLKEETTIFGTGNIKAVSTTVDLLLDFAIASWKVDALEELGRAKDPQISFETQIAKAMDENANMQRAVIEARIRATKLEHSQLETRIQLESAREEIAHLKQSSNVGVLLDLRARASKRRGTKRTERKRIGGNVLGEC